MSDATTFDSFKLNVATVSYVKDFYLACASHIEGGTAAEFGPTSRTAWTWTTWPEKVAFNVSLFRKWAEQFDRYEFSDEAISEEEMLEQALIVIADHGRQHMAFGETRPVTYDMEKVIIARLADIEAARVARRNRIRGEAKYFTSDFIWDRPQRRMPEWHVQHYLTKKSELPTHQ